MHAGNTQQQEGPQRRQSHVDDLRVQTLINMPRTGSATIVFNGRPRKKRMGLNKIAMEKIVPGRHRPRSTGFQRLAEQKRRSAYIGICETTRTLPYPTLFSLGTCTGAMVWDVISVPCRILPDSFTPANCGFFDDLLPSLAELSVRRQLDRSHIYTRFPNASMLNRFDQGTNGCQPLFCCRRERVLSVASLRGKLGSTIWTSHSQEISMMLWPANGHSASGTIYLLREIVSGRVGSAEATISPSFGQKHFSTSFTLFNSACCERLNEGKLGVSVAYLTWFAIDDRRWLLPA